MLKILLDRTEPSADVVKQQQNFTQILAACNYQKQVMNPWRYWYFPLWILAVLMIC
jgi:hypothetical protein